ncbi:MAG: hypothetical protein JWP04_1001 [Belnapia sp.]|nr:hypothetical protein [Belnapia sp.]
MDSAPPPSDRDLHGVLTALSHAAADLVAQPLRPVSEHLCGYIESLWSERPGAVWLTGWVSRDVGQEFAVVVADRRKYAGAVAIACYDRPDLPPHAHAFIGLLQTDWQPTPETTDVFAFIGPELKRFIRSVSPLRLQDGPGFAAEFGRVQTLCHVGRVNALRGAMLSGRSWLPDTGALSGASVKAAADEIMVLPGFGCFVQGWILSPTKRLVRLSLKLADRVLHSMPGGLYFLPRPDLGSAMPGMPTLLDRAGFVAVLTGALQPEDLVAPVLKAWFSDGTSVNFPLDPLAIRRLGHALPFEAILRLFPGAANESFFDRCASAIRHEVTGRLAEAQPLNRAPPAERVLVVALPAQASDVRLVIDQIAYRLGGRRPAPAVVLLAELGAARAQLPSLAAQIEAATGAPCATFLIEDTGRPLFALATVLDMLGARRFLFLGAGVFPDAAAWTEGLDACMGDDEALAVITATNGMVLGGLAWTTAGFRQWLDEDGLPIGATHTEALLERGGTVAGGARLVQGSGRPDLLIESVDAVRHGKGHAA